MNEQIYSQTDAWLAEPSSVTVPKLRDHYNAMDSEYDSENPELLLSRPPAAFTSRSNQQWKPPPPSELTPPPSPTRQQSPTGSAGSRHGVGGALNRTMSLRGGRAAPWQSSEVASPSTETSTLQSHESEAQSSTSKPRSSKSTLGDLFSISGSSAPVNIGFVPSTKKESTLNDVPGVVSTSQNRTARPAQHLRRSSTLSVAASFLGLGRPSPRQLTISEEGPSDLFSTLNIADELLPAGPGPHVTEAAFDDLFANAECLILRMQAAYRIKCDELQRSAHFGLEEQDELEEARMRASLLRSQLDGMSVRVSEQDEAMKSLAEELVSEKQKREADAQSRRMSLRVVAGPEGRERLFSRDTELGIGEAESESGDESVADSVFSRQSGRLANSNASVSSAGESQFDGGHAAIPTSFASLREENLALRARVTELEETVEGCLGMFNSIGD